jgi:hypothetical protein
LQTNFIAVGGGPGGDMGDAQESPSAIGITVDCHSSGKEKGANGKVILPNKVSTTLIPKTEQAFPGHPQSSRPYPDNIQNLLKDKKLDREIFDNSKLARRNSKARNHWSGPRKSSQAKLNKSLSN